MHILAGETELLIRAAEADDDDFILGLVPRFVDFELPKGRKRHVVSEGIRRDLTAHLEHPRPASFLFIAESDEGERIGFLHLQTAPDFFSGGLNCHISDLAVAKGREGQGIGRALLDYAESFAREHRCERITLSVFPGNERARRMYEAAGYGLDLIRMARPL